MKQRVIIAAAIALAAIIVMGCGSTPKEAEIVSPKEISQQQNAANVGTQANPSTILDWSNRNIGEDSVPGWLKPLVRGNTQAVKQAFGVNPAARVKYSIAQRANRDEARVQAGLLFAAQIANELKQYVVTAAAQNLNQGQMDIVEQITTATKINITGNNRVTDFWQLVETTDAQSGARVQEYIFYTVWSMDESIWSQLVRKYTNDVIGQIPDRQVQTQIANAFGEIDAVSKREREMSDAEFQQTIDLRYQAATDAQSREMARINSNTVVSVAQAEADSNARYAAYRSGNPVVAAIASTTSADVDWISALATASKVLY